MLTSGTRELKADWDAFVGRHPYMMTAAALVLGAGLIVKVNIDSRERVNQAVSECVDKGGKPNITTHFKRRPTVDCQVPETPASGPQ